MSGPDARTGLEVLRARARRDVDDGLLPSVQIGVARDGELLLDETFGAPADARYVCFSVTKAFTGAIAWLLVGDGVIDARTRVADVVPEFAGNGKQDVTVEHLLTHTAGFPRAPMRPEEGADRAARVERMATWRLDWPPGTQTEYHATSAYWALVEVIDRVTGHDFRRLFTERVAAELGLPDLVLGAPVDQQDRVQRIRGVGDAGDGTTLGDHVKETGEEFLLRFNEPEVVAAGVPGAGAIARAADVALFYQALLHNPKGVWDDQVLHTVTTDVRNTFTDSVVGAKANRSLGLCVHIPHDGPTSRLSPFGGASAGAYGHDGAAGQIGWADPRTGLSFAYLTNGYDRNAVRMYQRGNELARLAAACVS